MAQSGLPRYLGGMKNLYLALAVVGAVAPYVFFVDYFAAEGLNFVGFISALFANGVVTGFTVDLVISSIVFWVFLIQMKAERIWLFVLLNLTIGLSCALPAYLYARELAAEPATA